MGDFDGVDASEQLAEMTGRDVSEFVPDFDEHPLPSWDELDWVGVEDDE
jgi:hypothetical protein